MTEAAAARWARLQAGRGIPAEIVAAAPADPWYHDPAWFTAPPVPVGSPSWTAGLALLATPGSVLDVGCGGGDAAFGLAERATELIGVDRQTGHARRLHRHRTRPRRTRPCGAGRVARRGRGGGIRRRGGRGALTRPRVAATLTWSGGE